MSSASVPSADRVELDTDRGGPGTRDAVTDHVHRAPERVSDALRDQDGERFSLGRRPDAGHGRVAEDGELKDRGGSNRRRLHHGVDPVAGIGRRNSRRVSSAISRPMSASSPTGRPISSARRAAPHAPGRFHSLPSTKRSRFQIGSRSLICSMTYRFASYAPRPMGRRGHDRHRGLAERHHARTMHDRASRPEATLRLRGDLVEDAAAISG